MAATLRVRAASLFAWFGAAAVRCLAGCSSSTPTWSASAGAAAGTGRARAPSPSTSALFTRLRAAPQRVRPHGREAAGVPQPASTGPRSSGPSTRLVASLLFIARLRGLAAGAGCALSPDRRPGAGWGTPFRPPASSLTVTRLGAPRRARPRRRAAVLARRGRRPPARPARRRPASTASSAIPLYFAWALLVFGAPHMTMTRFTFAVVSTLYLASRSRSRSAPDRGVRRGLPRYQRTVRWRMIPGIY